MEWEGDTGVVAANGYGVWGGDAYLGKWGIPGLGVDRLLIQADPLGDDGDVPGRIGWKSDPPWLSYGAGGCRSRGTRPTAGRSGFPKALP